MIFGIMNEIDRDASLTRTEKVALGLLSLWPLLLVLGLSALAGGCIGTKASHQNGIVLYVSTSGQLGVGYGETEDLPGGCTYYREVVNVSPCFWSSGTNYTRTVTRWDTRGMLTNAAPCKCEAAAAEAKKE